MTRLDPRHSEPCSRADAEALRWMTRLQSGDATPAMRAELRVWLEAHPGHRQEFEGYLEVWKGLDTIRPRLAGALDEAEAYWQSHKDRPAFAFRLRSRLAMSAAIGMVAVALALVLVRWWSPSDNTYTGYQTAKGEQQTIALDDGSRIMLNTDTSLAVQFSDDDRSIKLDRGEAWFHVAHDPDRPFHVEAGNGMIEDLGTEFVVKTSDHQVNIAVLEGAVKVGVKDTLLSALTGKPRILKKGQQVSYTLDGRFSVIETIDGHAIDAWRDGKLIFNAQPLGDVLTEIARYTSHDIQLRDPSLAQLPISGIYNIRALDRFPQTLQESFPLTATRITPDLTMIDRASGR